MKQQIKSYNYIRFSQIHSVSLQPLERNIKITQKKTYKRLKMFLHLLLDSDWKWIQYVLYVIVNCDSSWKLQNNNLLHIWKTGKIFSITYYICSFEKQHASNVMAGALQNIRQHHGQYWFWVQLHLLRDRPRRRVRPDALLYIWVNKIFW